MAQQTTLVGEVLAGIDREIATVESEYKAALAMAAERLQANERTASATGTTSVLVEDEAPPEIEQATAMTLHKLETRLDQLKELRTWIKVDPDLALFVAPLHEPPAQRPPVAAASSEAAPPSLPARRGIPVVLTLIAVLVALAAGWLLSLIVPIAGLLPH